MIRLDSPTKRLQVVLAAPVATNQADVVVSYSDASSVSYVGGSQVGTSSDTTAADICSAPPAGRVRDVDFVAITNRDTAVVTARVLYDVAGVAKTLVKAALAVGDSLTYTHGAGWQVTDQAGAIKYAVNSLTVGGLDILFAPAKGRASAQTAAVASVVSATVGAADSLYQVSASVLVTASTTHDFTLQLAYTDDSGTSRTVTLNLQNAAGTIGTHVANAGGTGVYLGLPVLIRAKAGTTITLSTVGTFTSVTYSVDGAIAKQ